MLTNHITPLYEQVLNNPGLMEPNNIKRLSKRIHRLESDIWQLERCLENIQPYCFRFKRKDVPYEIVTKRKEALELRAERELVKRSIPKKLWYPRYKKCGRFGSSHNDIKTKIMIDCWRYGFNAKQIAGYFNVHPHAVYRRIKVKELKLKYN